MRDLPEVAVCVVGPGFVDLAARADDDAVRRVALRVLAETAFDVTPADVDRLGVRSGQAELAAELVELLRREQRVAAGQRVGDEEGTRRCDLRDALVVHVGDLGIHLERVVEAVVAECADRDALVGTLQVVGRLVVVQLALALHEVRTRDDEVEAVRVENAEVREAALRQRRRATACPIGRRCPAERTVVGVAEARKNRVDLTITCVQRYVTVAVRGIRADHHRDVGREAVGDVVLRQVETGITRQVEDAVVVFRLVERVLVVERKAFEVALRDEVDDAGNRVRTVGCGCATGQDFDAIDECGRDLVEVGAESGLLW